MKFSVNNTIESSLSCASYLKEMALEHGFKQPNLSKRNCAQILLAAVTFLFGKRAFKYCKNAAFSQIATWEARIKTEEKEEKEKSQLQTLCQQASNMVDDEIEKIKGMLLTNKVDILQIKDDAPALKELASKYNCSIELLQFIIAEQENPGMAATYQQCKQALLLKQSSTKVSADTTNAITISILLAMFSSIVAAFVVILKR